MWRERFLSNRQIRFAIPIVLYLSLSILYLLSVPVGESPDEPGHLQCIEQVSQSRRLPQVDPVPRGVWSSRTAIISGYMCYHMPLYYLTSGALQLAWHSVADVPLHFEFPPNNPEWGTSPAMFLHGERWGLAESSAVTILRLESLLLGAIVLWATHRLAEILFPSYPLVPLTATILLAGWPQFLYMSRAINNDLLSTALSVLVLITLLASKQPSRYIQAAILSSLAVLAKLTAGFTIGVVLASYTLEFWLEKKSRRLYIGSGVAMFGTFLLLAGIIVLEPTLRENFLGALTLFGGTHPETTTVSYWLDVLELTASSGWARLGWMNLATPVWQTYIWWAFILSGTLTGIFVLQRDRRRPANLLMLILALWGGGVILSYLRINLNRFQPQFRYVFSLLPVLGSLTAAGYLSWFQKRRHLAVVLLISLLVLVNLWLVFGLIVPVYFS